MVVSEPRILQSELGKRVASAIVMLLVVLSVSWVGGMPFTLLSIALSAVLFYEWQSIVRLTRFDGTEAALTLGFALILLGILLGFWPIALLLFLALGLVLELTSHGDEKSDVRWIGLGAVYCAIPALCFPLIRDAGGFAVLMLTFLIVWATDIAAYFAGRRFGGPKLLASVSPKKTWSGAFGGIIGAFVVAVLLAVFQGWSVLGIAMAAIVLSTVSQMGDLFESWVKRVFDVKDSSNLIPGHGGFLDRVDGLVAAAVPVAVILALNVA